MICLGKSHSKMNIENPSSYYCKPDFQTFSNWGFCTCILLHVVWVYNICSNVCFCIWLIDAVEQTSRSDLWSWYINISALLDMTEMLLSAFKQKLNYADLRASLCTVGQSTNWYLVRIEWNCSSMLIYMLCKVCRVLCCSSDSEKIIWWMKALID